MTDISFFTSMLLIWYFSTYNASALIMERYDWCESLPRPEVKLYIHPKNFVRGAQVLDVHLITPRPLGNDLKSSMTLELEVIKHWQHLVSFDDDFCRAIQVYLGELGYELEEAMALPRKTCPIPKGNYHAVNFSVDVSRIKFQGFPFGRLRGTFRFVEKRTKHVLLCGVVIVDNKR